MPMRVGEMMVVVRAQDFASRTLRKVSGELMGMSRQQAMINQFAQRAQRAQLGLPKDVAGDLRHIQKRNALEQQFANNLARSRNATFGWTRAGQTMRAEITDMNNVIDRMNPATQMLASNTTEFARATKAIRAERVESMGRAMGSFGRTMQLVGGAGVLSLGLAAKTAADFDTQISLAATQAQNFGNKMVPIQTRIDQLSMGFDKNGKHVDGVIDMMNRYPATADAMADATFEVFSSMNLETNGIINVAKGMGLLEEANKIAVAGNEDLGVATNAMITVLNNFDPALQNTTEQFDTMFDIVRFGRMRLRDFDIMMNKIAPTAADAGLGLRDVGGAMAFLTQVMPSQRMVATGISRLIEALRHPDVVAGLDIFGVKVKKLDGRLRPLDEILRDIADRFPQLRSGQKSAAEFFREISAAGRGTGRGQIFTAEGRRALSEIITHFDEYIARQKQIDKNSGEFKRATDAQMQSLGVQWGIFVNQVRAAALVIGQEAVPVFAEIGHWLGEFVKWFKGLNPEVRKAIVQTAAYAAVLALISGIILTIVGAFTAAAGALRLFSLTAGAGAGKMARFVGMLKFMMKAAGAALVFQVLIKTMWGGDPGAREFLQGALGGALLGGSIGGLPGAVVGAITVPIAIHAISQQGDLGDKIAADIRKNIEDKTPFWKRYGEYIAKNMEAGIMEGFMSEDEFRAFERQAEVLDARERGMTEGAIRGGEKVIRQRKEQSKQEKKYKDDLKAYYDELQAQQEANTARARQLAETVQSATQQATQALRSMFSELQQANEQAFGQFAQGPWLTSQTFDLAKEWGITPRIQDLIRDLRLQNQQFAEWRRGLDALFKKGVPTEMIDELRSMGPEEGQPIIDNILRAKPGQVNALISEWKKRNKQIQDATKIDFSREINQFRKAGVNMGEAIIDGFQDAKVGAYFDAWITTNFPDLINQAVGVAVGRFKESNPPAPKLTKPKDPSPKPTIQYHNHFNQRFEVGSPEDKAAHKRLAHEVANGVITKVGKSKGNRPGTRSGIH